MDNGNSQKQMVEAGDGDMRLGRLEFLAMNNPLRRWLQKHIEFRIFKNQLQKRDIHLEDGVIMDAGCGSGYSTELIVNEYHPSQVIAFDYMPEQVRSAERRRLNVEFLVGDLRGIECESSTCDAVFIFGVLHHIAEWKKALCEVARVLKPGGVLLFDEPRYLFTWAELEAGVKSTGMDILELQTFFFHYFHAYLCQKRLKAPAQRPPG
jgi:ubiquinone/menaquinone biosynthesis C-methylase UbiE